MTVKTSIIRASLPGFALIALISVLILFIFDGSPTKVRAAVPERTFCQGAQAPLDGCAIAGNFQGCLDPDDTLCFDSHWPSYVCIPQNENCSTYKLDTFPQQPKKFLTSLTRSDIACEGSGLGKPFSKSCTIIPYMVGGNKPFECSISSHSACQWSNSNGSIQTVFCVPETDICEDYGAQDAAQPGKAIAQIVRDPLPPERIYCEYASGKYITAQACKSAVQYRCATGSDIVCRLSQPTYTTSQPIGTTYTVSTPTASAAIFCIPNGSSCGFYGAKQILPAPPSSAPKTKTETPSSQTSPLPSEPSIVQTPASEKQKESFANETECKKYYRKLRNDVRKKKLEYGKLDISDFEPQLKDLTDLYLEEAKTFVDRDLKDPSCDLKKPETLSNYEIFFRKAEELEQLTNLIEEELLTLEEQRVPLTIRLSKERKEQAKEKGFREAALSNRHVGAIIEDCLSYPWLMERANNLVTGIENLQHLGKKYQGDFVEGKQTLCEKADTIVKMMEEKRIEKENQQALISALMPFLQTHWDSSLTKIISAKFDQAVFDLKKGLKPQNVTKDLEASYTKRAEDNLFELHQRGVVKFCDASNTEWYFSVFQNPKQVAFRGSGCNVFPLNPLKATEALVALVRSLQIPLIPEEESVNIPNSIKDLPEWGKQTMATVLSFYDNTFGAVEKLRLSSLSMGEPLNRSIFALWIFELSKKEELAMQHLLLPETSEVTQLKKDFEDLASFSRDRGLLEAIAFVRKNGLMTGKKSDEFGVGPLLRAEAAKVLFLLSEKITGGN